MSTTEVLNKQKKEQILAQKLFERVWPVKNNECPGWAAAFDEQPALTKEYYQKLLLNLRGWGDADFNRYDRTEAAKIMSDMVINIIFNTDIRVKWGHILSPSEVLMHALNCLYSAIAFEHLALPDSRRDLLVKAILNNKGPYDDVENWQPAWIEDNGSVNFVHSVIFGIPDVNDLEKVKAYKTYMAASFIEGIRKVLDAFSCEIYRSIDGYDKDAVNRMIEHLGRLHKADPTRFAHCEQIRQLSFLDIFDKQIRD